MSIEGVLLVVEDSDEDYMILTRALNKLNFPHAIHRCRDGNECIQYMTDIVDESTKNSAPSLILLDLNLPGTTGYDVLEFLKNNPVLKTFPVSILTSSNSPTDVYSCYLKGANSYITKRSDFKEYQKVVGHLVSFWFNAATLYRFRVQ